MKNKMTLSALVWVVFVDSMGWGIAFSVFAALFLTDSTTILSQSISASTRYMIYESLLAIYSFFMFFFAPVLGGIADRFGRKPGLLISMIGLTFGFMTGALGCYLGNIWFLLIGRIVSGMTAGSLSIAQAAAVDISNEKNKSFNLSILMMANCLGFSLGPVLGDLLLNIHYAPIGTTTFIIGALMSLLGFFGIHYFFKETYQPNKNEEPFNILKDFANIKIAFTKNTLSNYLCSLLFSMVAFGLFFSNIPVFISRAFIEKSGLTGVILSTEAIFFSLTLMFGGKYLFQFFDKTKIVRTMQLLQFVAYALLAMSYFSFTFNVALFTLISGTTGLMYIALLTLISDATESDWQGRIMGVVAALSSVTWGVGPLLSGYLNQYGIAKSFLVCVMLLMIAMIAMIFLQLKKASPLANA